ncbi:MAG: cytochrome c biogenesis protein ResB [Phycisphaerae bacterium]|nr:cytochrome c biogenesis protein ResB [Phycisphaerae bacterium]
MATQKGLRSVLQALGSLWFAAVLLVLLLVAMACATVFESAHGTNQALAVFYHSWWFEVLLWLLGVNVLSALALRFPFSSRQIGFVLAHVSILVTFGGALVTKHFGVDGQVGLIEGQTADRFNVGGDALTVVSNADQSRSTVDWSAPLGRRFRPGEVRGARPLTLGDLRIEVVRCLPDSEWRRQVLNDTSSGTGAGRYIDSAAGRPAVELVLSGDGRDEPAWVFAGQTATVGGVPVSYRQIADRDELDRLVNPAPSTQPASKSMIRLEHQGTAYEFPLEEGLDAPVSLGDTGYTARVLRYLPHATVGPNNRVVGVSDRPVNPYVEVELVGPDGGEMLRAFAKFPDFASMHGAKQADRFKLVLTVSSDARPATPVELLEGPNGELYVCFAQPGFDVFIRRLEMDTAVQSPWPDRELRVLRHYEHARDEWKLEPVEPIREARTPAVLLRLGTGEDISDELWLQKYRPRSVTVAGTSYDLTYSDRIDALGFSITLDSFRVGYYPGGRRPRSFESHVTLTDPNTGRTHSRVISMNHPTSLGGYTFYQSSYRQEHGQTVSFLSVARDPGQPIVFTGYIGMMVGMLVILVTRVQEHRRKGS